MAMSLEPTSSSSSLLRSSGATSLPYLFLNSSQFANIEKIYAILPDMTDALKAHGAQMTKLLAIQDNQAMLNTNGAGVDTAEQNSHDAGSASSGNVLMARALLSATGVCTDLHQSCHDERVDTALHCCKKGALCYCCAAHCS